MLHFSQQNTQVQKMKIIHEQAPSVLTSVVGKPAEVSSYKTKVQITM